MTITALYLGLGAHYDTAASCLVGLLYAFETIYIGSGGEIGCRDVLHQSIGIYIRIVDIGAAAIYYLTQVVSRDIGSHSNGYTVAAIDQQVRYLGRHHRRLYECIIEVVGHVYRFLIKIVHDVFAHLGKAALCVTHSSRRVAIDTTEITLSVNELVAHIPVLPHTYQSSVDRAVAVGVVLTKHLAYHAGTLFVGFVAGVADTQHTV